MYLLRELWVGASTIWQYKIKMLSLPVIYHFFSASVDIYTDAPLYFPYLMVFLYSLREFKGATHTAHTQELLLGVVSPLITGMSFQMSLVRYQLIGLSL